jgi:NAD(P)-dependent dehydrogenase (short-subunit alcohol dehydrogenase family)
LRWHENWPPTDATSRWSDVADEIGARTGRRVVGCAFDLCRPDAAEALVARAVEALGRLDILVSCASEFKRGDLLSLSDEDWETGFGAMVFGAFRVVKAAWPHLKAVRGRIVMIAGVFALKPPAAGALPGVLAASVLNFTKSAAELGLRDGIAVNCVLPGPITGRRMDENLTRFAEQRGLGREAALQAYADQFGIERLGTPEDVATAIAFLASPAAEFIRGAGLLVDGGLLRSI